MLLSKLASADGYPALVENSLHCFENVLSCWRGGGIRILLALRDYFDDFAKLYRRQIFGC